MRLKSLVWPVVLALGSYVSFASCSAGANASLVADPQHNQLPALLPELELELERRQACTLAGIHTNCAGNATKCISYICSASCGAATPAYSKCCAGATLQAQTQCLLKAIKSQASVQSSMTASITADPGYRACQTVVSVLSSCSRATPDFLLYSPSVQASCVCYASGSFRPSAWDGVFDACYTYDAAVNPRFWESVLRTNSFTNSICSVLGDVRGGGAGGGSQTVTSTTTLPQSTISTAASTSSVAASQGATPTVTAAAATSTNAQRAVKGQLPALMLPMLPLIVAAFA